MLEGFFEFLLQNQTLFLGLGVVVAVSIILLEIESIRSFKKEREAQIIEEIKSDFRLVSFPSVPFIYIREKTCTFQQPHANQKSIRKKVPYVVARGKPYEENWHTSCIEGSYVICGSGFHDIHESYSPFCKTVRKGDVFESTKRQARLNIC